MYVFQPPVCFLVLVTALRHAQQWTASDACRALRYFPGGGKTVVAHAIQSWGAQIKTWTVLGLVLCTLSFWGRICGNF